ncbi:MaoC family dehydratase N-terminal domain-containing protein [Ensifer adhaerens]|uniref:MaoC family dehydratase n=1 Tax=Ensifer adhaerens TaxID=106592 RepID=UPI001CBDC5A3|nr:MaoC/PaaZ C-terminal domain-containing protein [Ensifer adhaerens]MBZ7924259.1 MaoC family dehydratase N-terminal domain-containing protein [Ensifer adhaerens]UAX96488.1 MaoC family dehydratase N-terminal domain-containing protein [Ensifer adhaerens]UAY04169.1 MaoC family dehydratase N-terminal domain-containing protein [Ensifer adhaerens]UAY12155.1 MaoC family dehydratase N-terminal domain-containing protein [Ensifer adhaerens]
METQLFGDDFAVGDVFEGIPHEIGDEQFNMFAQLTGDNHPIHYDDAFAAKTRFGKRLAHGLLLVSMTALGATPMSARLEDALVAFVDQEFRFLRPVFINDVLKSRFEVISVIPKAANTKSLVRFKVELINSRSEIVVEGHHTYLLHCRLPLQKERTI